MRVEVSVSKSYGWGILLRARTRNISIWKAEKKSIPPTLSRLKGTAY